MSTDRLRLSRRLLLGLPLGYAFAGSAGATTATPAPPNKPFWEWFKHEPEVEEDWIVSPVAGRPFEVVIRPINPDRKQPVRRVFVLYPRPSSAYDIAISKILDVFDDKHINAEFTVVNFRNEDALARQALARAKFLNAELVFSMGSEATAWLHMNLRDGSIPVVSVCSKDPVLLGQMKNYESGSGTNFAFTSLNMPIDAQMAYVIDFRPQLRNMGILVSRDNVSAVETQARPIAEFAKQRGIQVLYLQVENPATAQAELAELVRSAVVTMRKSDPSLDNSLFWITGSTAVFDEIATINKHSDRVPVLSVVPEVVRAGDDSAVLSIGISFESNAHLAAIYGADVLMGVRQVGTLPVGIVSPPDIAINFRKAREIGLSVPFEFVERASTIYDYDGQALRKSAAVGTN
ncbi:MAG: hypothetical protein JNK67_31115 [Alphaproteobacteria bacterium]|nr:hypothetical protein [Alphaproteobacteria bacterium]